MDLLWSIKSNVKYDSDEETFTNCSIHRRDGSVCVLNRKYIYKGEDMGEWYGFSVVKNEEIKINYNK